MRARDFESWVNSPSLLRNWNEFGTRHLCVDPSLVPFGAPPDRTSGNPGTGTGILYICRQRLRSRWALGPNQKTPEKNRGQPLAYRLPEAVARSARDLVHPRSGQARTPMGEGFTNRTRVLRSPARFWFLRLQVWDSPRSLLVSTGFRLLLRCLSTWDRGTCSCRSSHRSPEPWRSRKRPHSHQAHHSVKCRRGFTPRWMIASENRNLFCGHLAIRILGWQVSRRKASPTDRARSRNLNPGRGSGKFLPASGPPEPAEREKDGPVVPENPEKSSVSRV